MRFHTNRFMGYVTTWNHIGFLSLSRSLELPLNKRRLLTLIKNTDSVGSDFTTSPFAVENNRRLKRELMYHRDSVIYKFF